MILFSARLSQLTFGLLFLSLFLGIGSIGEAEESGDKGSLQPLKYNNPGLVVDLGVGLWAWPVPCDADGDGDLDLIVSCPDKPYNGVWFFENASGSTKNNKLPVFKPAKRLSHTVHYVMPSYVDGKMRVLTPGAEYLNFTKTGLNEKVALPIPANFYWKASDPKRRAKVRHNQWRYVDYDGDGKLDLVVGIEDWLAYGWDDAWDEQGVWKNGKLHGFVFLFHNSGTTEKPEYDEPVKINAGGSPVDVFGCPSPNFCDFDDDGDLDLLCGEFLDGFTYFENVGTRQKPDYKSGVRLTKKDGSMLTMNLEMIAPVAIDWDLDGDIDLVVGDEDGRVALVENTGVLNQDRSPQFLAPVYFQQEADFMKCGSLATPVGVDWDGDGDDDIVSGNTTGYIEFFENLSGPGVEVPRWAAPVRLQAGGKTFRSMAGPNGSIQGPAEAKWGYTTLNVGDWDGDGLLDIIYNDIWGKVRWLQNVGTRTGPKLAASKLIEVQCEGDPPKPEWTWWKPKKNELVTQWRTTPLVVDWNKDGLNDLVMLDVEGYLSLYERAKQNGKLVLLPPRRCFSGENFSVTDGNHRIKNSSAGLLQLNQRKAGGSGRRKFCVVDWNGDGKLDILANSINANLLLQTKSADQHWTFRDQGPLLQKNIQGHTTSPTVVDFNGDGIPDFLGGAEDGRFYYEKNPRSVQGE
ncbi:MAG: VCBS repeat-containing protein [Planctomycetaceae bacterium]|nr:VCBS repeat-containing protein [Planctomycetaceae bacterium]